eukprot:4752815-Pleurochrysis_carterae.AAC.2
MRGHVHACTLSDNYVDASPPLFACACAYLRRQSNVRACAFLQSSDRACTNACALKSLRFCSALAPRVITASALHSTVLC